jgi:hypothetical protein
LGGAFHPAVLFVGQFEFLSVSGLYKYPSPSGDRISHIRINDNPTFGLGGWGRVVGLLGQFRFGGKRRIMDLSPVRWGWGGEAPAGVGGRGKGGTAGPKGHLAGGRRIDSWMVG